jgi:REP element-mobilizing transposase RayT
MGNVLYRNRYRVPSTRLSGWDYARGVYCVTICTQDRICWLGDVVKGEMILSDLGEIVAEEWEEMARRRPHVDLDAWVVMPNHLHGILFLQPCLDGRPRPLGEALGHFKGACSDRIWAKGRREFAWQPRFFDQIIRNEETLLKFRRYIQENPLHWEIDRHHPETCLRPPTVPLPM